MNAQAIQTVSEHPVPAPVVNEAAAIIQVIERAASNPDVDIEKMERLLDMHERVKARNAKTAYAAALAEMQPQLPVIEERGEIKHGDNKPVQSTYAKWEDINEAIRPILAEYGFALSFRIGRAEGLVSVTGILSHREGHSEETTFDLPVDSSGSKNSVQALGSSVSYGQRYTAKALLNLTSRHSVDDDGRAAGAGGFVNEEQAETIKRMMVEVGADPRRFLAHIKAETVEAIPARKFQDAVSALRDKGRRNG